MAGLTALAAADFIAALLTGGFRVSRRENGLALLVRGCDVVVVREHATLDRARMLTLLDRAGVREDELFDWLGAREGSAPMSTTRSGFHRRTRLPSSMPADGGVPGEGRSLDELVLATRAARARADAADVGARQALAASRQALDEIRTTSAPHEERLRAVQRSLEQWDEAIREVEAEEQRERRRRKR